MSYYYTFCKLLLFNNTYTIQYLFDSSIKCIKINNYYYSRYSFQYDIDNVIVDSLQRNCYIMILLFVFNIEETSIASESFLKLFENSRKWHLFVL